MYFWENSEMTVWDSMGECHRGYQRPVIGLKRECLVVCLFSVPQRHPWPLFIPVLSLTADSITWHSFVLKGHLLVSLQSQVHTARQSHTPFPLLRFSWVRCSSQIHLKQERITHYHSWQILFLPCNPENMPGILQWQYLGRRYSWATAWFE